MLMKADSPKEYARCFAEWRAMLPHWNAEADRFRKLAIAARSGAPIEIGAFDEAEQLVEQMRSAMVRADTLMATCVAGDSRLSSLMGASNEFSALLESLQKTLEMSQSALPTRQRPALRVISPQLAAV